mgnify:FL=1
MSLILTSNVPLSDISGWGVSPRGAGYLFGGDVVKGFVHTNGLDFIARAHQLILEGYKQMFDATIVTVWSAPNYCYRCGNVASVFQVDDLLDPKSQAQQDEAQEESRFNPSHFKIFDAVPDQERTHPARSTASQYFL